MSIINSVIMATMLSIGVSATASGAVVPFTERSKALVKGLAKAIVTKLADPKGQKELVKVISQQKQRFIMHVDEDLLDVILTHHVGKLHENSKKLTLLMEKEVLGELTKESVYERLTESYDNSGAVKVLRDAFDNYSDSDFRDHIQKLWASSATILDKVERMVAIEDVKKRRQAVANYFATLLQETFLSFSIIAWLKKRNMFNKQAAARIDLQQVIEEKYLDSLHHDELVSLAQALELGDLILATESNFDKVMRKERKPLP